MLESAESESEEPSLRISGSDKSEQIGLERTSLEIDTSDKRSVLVFYLGLYRIIDKRLDRKNPTIKTDLFSGN